MSTESRIPYVLIEGSASPEADVDVLEAAHRFVERLVDIGLSRGAGFVVVCGSDPLHVKSARTRLTFGWTIIHAVARHYQQRECKRPSLQLIARLDQWQLEQARPERAPESQETKSLENQLLSKKLVLDGVATVETLPQEAWVGGRIRAIEAEQASALITIGGGKGTLELRRLMKEKNAPVLPVKCGWRGSRNDADADQLLVGEFRNHPGHFLLNAGAEAQKFLHELYISTDAEQQDRAACLSWDLILENLQKGVGQHPRESDISTSRLKPRRRKSSAAGISADLRSDEPHQKPPATATLARVPLTPIALLREAVGYVPSLKYAFGICAAVSCMAIGKSFGIGQREGVLGCIIMIPLMTGFLVYSLLARWAKKGGGQFRWAAVVLLWAYVGLVCAAPWTLYSCVFFRTPIDLHEWLMPSIKGDTH